MAETIEGQWHDEALGPGPQLIGPNEYLLTIEKTGETTRQVVPETVRYSPQVNTAKKIRMEVKSEPFLEGTTYLGGTAKVDVNGNRLFEGKIEDIQTNQQKDENYEITARSPGLKLNGHTVDERFNNIDVFDAIAQIVDEYNDTDNKHADMRGTVDESLSGLEVVTGDALRASGSSGTATYSNVGVDASNIDLVRCKLYTPGTDDITVDISTASNTYQETFSTADKNQYGEWVVVDPGTTFDGDTASYDIQFTLNGEAILWNWISLTSSELTRVVDPPDVSLSSTDKEAVSASLDADFQEIITIDPGEPLAVQNDRIELLQTSWFFEGEGSSTFGSAERDDDAYSGEISQARARVLGGTIGTTGDILTYTFTPDYDLAAENIGISFRNDWDDSDGSGTAGDNLPEVEVRLDGTIVEKFADGFSVEDTNLRWFDLFSPSPPDLTAGTQSTLEIEQTADTGDYDEWIFDCVVVYDNRYNYDFDNVVTTGSTHTYLDGPEPYPDAHTKEMDQQIVDENIIALSIDSTFDDISNNQAIATSVNSGQTWQEASNTETIDNSYPYNIGVTADTRFTVGRYTSGTLETSPATGNEGQKIIDWTVRFDANNLDIIFDERIGDNRLGAISNIADDSTAFYRFDGSECQIFQRGVRTTNPDLRKEKIKSGVNIEEVYKTCEVIGLHNVRSGTITSESAPSYVTEHKEIRDRKVETEEDAVNRAKQFLRKNGDVRFTGTIRTLPTLAPLGEEMDGSHFNHSQSMFIKSVRYSKRTATITLGFDKNVNGQLVNISQSGYTSEEKDTSKGEVIPVGQDQYAE